MAGPFLWFCTLFMKHYTKKGHSVLLDAFLSFYGEYTIRSQNQKITSSVLEIVVVISMNRYLNTTVE